MKREKILIIGGTGFIGYHLSKFLISKNYKVTSLSTKPPSKNNKVIGVKYLFSDIVDFKNLNIGKENYQYVVNLSGYVDHSNNKLTYNTHYIGCVNLYEKLKKKKLKKFIQIGSSLEYGNLLSPQKERQVKRLKLNSVYSRSKLLATKFLQKKHKENNFPVTIIRAYQIYGPNQKTNRLIPFVIKNCLNNKSFKCSDGSQLRDFLYVDDFINGIYKILKKKRNLDGEIINLGFGIPQSVKYVIKLIHKYLKKGTPIFGKIKLRKDENIIMYPSIKKANDLLQWKPKISLENGLKKTINYFKQELI